MRVGFVFQLGTLDQWITLVPRSRHFGGHQWYFVCPVMNRDCSVVWLPPGANNYELGQFQKFLAVGAVHRLHHVNWTGQGDVNFGLFFTFWDSLLGTLKLASERAPSAGDIGIQDYPCFPQHYMTQLMLPFTNHQAVSTVDQASKRVSKV